MRARDHRVVRAVVSRIKVISQSLDMLGAARSRAPTAFHAAECWRSPADEAADFGSVRVRLSSPASESLPGVTWGKEGEVARVASAW